MGDRTSTRSILAVSVPILALCLPILPVSGGLQGQGRLGSVGVAPVKHYAGKGLRPLPKPSMAVSASESKPAQLPLLSSTSQSAKSPKFHTSSDKMLLRSNLVLAKSSESNQDQSVAEDKPLLPKWLPLFLVPALGGSLFGYDIGATSAVVRILGQGDTDLGSLDSLKLGLLASLPLLGAVVASAGIIGVGDKNIGRKTELYLASILYGVGTVVQSFGPELDIVLLGRIIYGLGIGVAMHAAPLYIAETTPTNLRGKLVSLKEAAIVLGIVGGYASGAIFNSGDASAWRQIFEVALPFEMMMLVSSTALLKESPRWLVLRGKKEEAIDALTAGQGLTRTSATATVEEMMNIKGGLDVSEESSFVDTVKEIVQNPANRKALTIGVGLVLLQQLSGQPSVLYYANRIFEKAGLGFEAAVGVGVFKTIMTLVSVGLVEDPKWGRRPLLLTGTAGMTASLAALATLFQLSGGGEPSSAAVLACVVAFVGFYQIGFGPVTWLILSEIFPLKVRSTALSIGTLSNFASNFLVSALFEVEREFVGEAALFAQFALIAAFAVWFESAVVPETRGLSLEEIEAKLNEPE